MSQPGLSDPLRAGRRSGHGNGERLLNEGERSLDESRLCRALGGNRLVDRVVLLPTVDSTNDEIRRRAARGAASGLVVIAEAQSAGRGRRGRPWHSAPGLGLYISVLLRPAIPVAQVRWWTLGAAVAGCLACRAVADCAVEIEWPNDLVVGRRKVGGILTELRSAGGAARELVIGAGFNVHHGASDWPPELDDVAVSLRQATPCGIVVTREALATAYLSELAAVAEILRAEGWDRVASRWTGLSPAARDARVRVRQRSGELVCGVTAGLDGSGALRVRTTRGGLVRVHMAESVTVEED